MKKYQIAEDFGKNRHAGSKAKNDAIDILDELGFEKVYIKHFSDKQGFLPKIARQMTIFSSWLRLSRKIEKGAVLFRQSPFHTRQLGRNYSLGYLKNKKNVFLVTLVHDVELIRSQDESERPALEREFSEVVDYSDVLIIHNNSMKRWLVDYGIPEEKLVVLDIFDYLLEEQTEKEINFSKNIYIAGNLAKEKSPYVHLLGHVSNVQFQLMGVNYEPDKEAKNVNYLGSFAPEDVPSQLNNGFGLVWDGESVDTCSGPTGNYLRYNNPHKLSLYLASGLPVIVWKESAEANLVERLGLGISVDSLHELESILDKITNEDYEAMVKRVSEFAPKLQKGFFLKQAMDNSLELKK